MFKLLKYLFNMKSILKKETKIHKNYSSSMDNQYLSLIADLQDEIEYWYKKYENLKIAYNTLYESIKK